MSTWTFPTPWIEWQKGLELRVPKKPQKGSVTVLFEIRRKATAEEKRIASSFKKMGAPGGVRIGSMTLSGDYVVFEKRFPIEDFPSLVEITQ